MFNAPTMGTIERAKSLGCNWAIVHSAGIEEGLTDPASGRPMDMFPIYFEDYPKVAEYRHQKDAVWLEPLRADVRGLCEKADQCQLDVAFHMYEPTLPHVFEEKYPDLVGIYDRKTQGGIWPYHSHLDPDNPAVWDLMRSKYAELAREFPLMRMVIISTWDGAGSRWCIPDAKMPIHRRLAKQVETATEGVQSVRDDVIVCFRLWGRNWEPELYRNGHAMIEQITGLENATEYMLPINKPYNDPEVVLPKLFEELAADVPIMYKSTQFDIGDNQPLTYAVGTYPPEREQILEVSYELYHQKSWPWCKIAHIRKGLDAVTEHDLAGFLALPINMGNNDRTQSVEQGNLGRMNTWLLERLLEGDPQSDAELVSAWLEKEFGSPQPDVVTEVLLEADKIADAGVQWGDGVTERKQFISLHTTKLTWMFPGFISPGFPEKMLRADIADLEALIAMKHDAYERASQNVSRITEAKGSMHPRLYEELVDGYTTFADYILLARDWHSYLVMQYAIERSALPADRKILSRMSRYVEQFISNLVRLRDTDAGRMAIKGIHMPDPFEMT